MSVRAAAWLAWAVCGLTLVLISATLGLAILARESFAGLGLPLIWVSGAVVGGLVASRLPGNLVGWLFLGGALGSAIRGFGEQYAIYGILAEPGSLPLTRTMVSVSSLLVGVGPVLAFVLLPLYFPNGKPVSPRWNLVAWIALALLPVLTALNTFSPGEAVYGRGIPNPLAVDALRPLADAVNPILFGSYIALIFAAAVSLVVRFRRSRGTERQQLKWFTYAAAFIPVWFLLNSPIERAFPNLFAVVDALVIAGVPVAAGIAILRYRLYDIDRIINRTLVYASLTAMLAALYLGGVVVLQYALRGLTGGGSQLAVVVSTLAIAALFNPLRRGIQSFIDRRFYRRKYDAAKTLASFGARLRAETDLDSLGDDLVGVVQETVQPEHASLWLRTARASGARNWVGETRE
jgi:hypothetical protein